MPHNTQADSLRSIVSTYFIIPRGHFISNVFQLTSIIKRSLVELPTTNSRNIVKTTKESLPEFINSWVSTFTTLVAS